MSKKDSSPLQAAFWLTGPERCFILAVCALLMLGIAVRCFYLKSRTAESYTPAATEEADRP